MRKRILIILCLSQYWMFGQWTEVAKNNIERNFDNRTYDSVNYFLKLAPKKKEAERQQYLTYKTRYYLGLKKMDSALFALSDLNKSLANEPDAAMSCNWLFLKGFYHYTKNSNDSASHYFITALNEGKKRSDTALQIKTLGSLSNVFANLGQFDKSISYVSQAINLARKKGDKDSEIFYMGNLFGFYGKRYQQTEVISYIDSAESVSKALIVKAKANNRVYELAKAYSGLGSCYFQYEKYDLILAYSDSTIQVADKNKHFRPIASAYGNRCDAFFALDQFSKAKTAADSALVYAKKLDEEITISAVYYKLFECENELKNYKSALEYFKLYSELNDKIRSEKEFETVNDLEQRYNKVENERTINDLTKAQQIDSLKINILVIAIVLFVIVVVLIVFIYRQKNLKQRHTLLETEQRLNRSRINPHFFFNSITTLQGLALTETDGKKMFKNLFVFSKLMRETLESSYSDLVPIKNEIEFLNNYIELQKLNQPDKFSFEITVKDEVDPETVLLPAMLLQPFIENSIEHGFGNMQSGGVIQLHFERADKELKVTITDNGMKSEENKKNDHRSRAMQITSDRLLLINKLYKTNSRFLINQNIPNGMKVEIYLPLDLKNESSDS